MSTTEIPVEQDISLLTFAQLREANVMRCEASYHPVSDYSFAEWLMCLTGEVGEIAHLLKRHRSGIVIDKSCLANELADVAIYLDLLAAALGISLGAAVARKFNQTSDMIDSKVKLPTDGPRNLDGQDLLYPQKKTEAIRAVTQGA